MFSDNIMMVHWNRESHFLKLASAGSHYHSHHNHYTEVCNEILSCDNVPFSVPLLFHIQPCVPIGFIYSNIAEVKKRWKTEEVKKVLGLLDQFTQ